MPNFRWICPKNMEKWQFLGALCAHKILILLNFAQKSLSYPLGHSEEYSPMSIMAQPPCLFTMIFLLLPNISGGTTIITWPCLSSDCFCQTFIISRSYSIKITADRRTNVISRLYKTWGRLWTEPPFTFVVNKGKY